MIAFYRFKGVGGLIEEVSEACKVKIYVMGKEYEVPSGLTIMKAMEYIGYRFIRGAGCRGGFCGACSTFYRVKDDYRLKASLACQKTIEEGMYLTIIPFVPSERSRYDLDAVRPSGSIILEYYPEVARCLSCNTCTKACPQDLEVMDYVQAALRGDVEEAARLSFECIQCGLCAVRCPAEVVPYHMAQLARRIYAKYIGRPSRYVRRRVEEVEGGMFNDELERLKGMGLEGLRRLYEERRIEGE